MCRARKIRRGPGSLIPEISFSPRLQKQRSGNRCRLYRRGFIGLFVQGIARVPERYASLVRSQRLLSMTSFTEPSPTSRPDGSVGISQRMRSLGGSVTLDHTLIAAHPQGPDPTLVPAGTNGNASSRNSTLVRIRVGQLPGFKLLVLNRIDPERVIGLLRYLRDSERGIAVFARQTDIEMRSSCSLPLRNRVCRSSQGSRDKFDRPASATWERTRRPGARRRSRRGHLWPRRGMPSTPEHTGAVVSCFPLSNSRPGRSTSGLGPDDPGRGEPSPGRTGRRRRIRLDPRGDFAPGHRRLRRTYRHDTKPHRECSDISIDRSGANPMACRAMRTARSRSRCAKEPITKALA